MKNKIAFFSMGIISMVATIAISSTTYAMGPTQADIVGIKPDGTMWQYLNNGTVSPFSSGSTQIGKGWNIFKDVTISDLDGDGDAEAIGYYKSQSTLPNGSPADTAIYQNKNNITNPFGSVYKLRINSDDFDGSVRYIYGDLDANGRKDLITIESNGKMHVQRGTSQLASYFSYQTPYSFTKQGIDNTLIGSGWNIFNTVLSADMNGDNYDDLVAIKPDGTLWLYINRALKNPIGTGLYYDMPSFTSGIKIGNGWNIFNTILLEDMNSDGLADIVARKSDGTLWQYLNNGNTSTPFSKGSTQIGKGWNIFNKIMLGNLHEAPVRSLTITAKDLTMFDGAKLSGTGSNQIMEIPPYSLGQPSPSGVSYDVIKFVSQNTGRNIQACVTGTVSGTKRIVFGYLNQSTLSTSTASTYYSAPTKITECSIFSTNNDAMMQVVYSKPRIGTNIQGGDTVLFHSLQLRAL